VSGNPQHDVNFNSSMMKLVEDDLIKSQEPNFRDSSNKAKYEAKKTTIGEYWATTMALFWKNVTRLRRNIP